MQDGRLVFMNQRLPDLLGLPRDRLMEAPFVDFIHPADRDMVYENYSRRIRGGQFPDSYDFRLSDKDGNPIRVLISAKAITYQGAFRG